MDLLRKHRPYIPSDIFTLITPYLSSSLFSFGLGDYGQLGHGDNRDCSYPKKIVLENQENLTNITQVVAGLSRSIIISNREAYSFGYGGDGRLSHGDNKNYSYPKKIERDSLGEKLTNITNIACGCDHNIIVNNREAYSFGYGRNGQLGHGDRENYSYPKKIENLSNITHIACGDDHTIIVSNGEAYSFGVGGYGQLGHGDRENYSYPKKIEATASGNREGLSNITHIACGDGHTIIVNNGEAYSFGDGGYGQLGHGDIENYSYPKKIVLENQEKLTNITSVACGHNHSIIVSNGEAYSFGYGGNGQLGHGNNTDYFYPKKIEATASGNQEGLSNITHIACGYNHSIIVSNGEAYSFGEGEYGQLGHGDNTNYSYPKKITSLSNITYIACGYSYSIVVSNDSIVSALSS